MQLKKKERKRKVAPDFIDKANEEPRKKRQLCSKKQMVSSVDFSMKIDDYITNDLFYDFEQSPECSALLYHLNSGHHKFYHVEKLIRSDTPPEEHKQCIKELKEEIEDEILTKEEMCKLMDEFCVAQGRATPDQTSPVTLGDKLDGLPNSVDAHHLVCGSCGVKSVHGQQHRKCTVVSLRALPPVMELTKPQIREFQYMKSNKPLMLPINKEGDLAPFYPYKVRSVYESTLLQKTFHLHPEYVHITRDSITNEECEMTVLCHNCSLWFQAEQKLNSGNPPTNSIAAGVDFGSWKRVGLCEPSTAEMIVIARIRHFHNVVKIQSNHNLGGRSDFTKSNLRAHSIAFRHDAPIMASIALMIELSSAKEKEKIIWSVQLLVYSKECSQSS